MCLTKIYYNTYADGAQDITEKTYPCRDGRRCSHPEVRKYDRKFPFTKLGDAQPESYRSLSERKPTPYVSSAHAARGSKSPSPSGRRDSGVYMTGANSTKRYYDYQDLYGYDAYGYHHSSSRHDPRDWHDRGREPRRKRSSASPQIVYVDREGKSSRSRSNSREYSRDVPLGLVTLADEYGRRRSSRSRSREGSSSREGSDHHRSSHRRHRTDDPYGYVLIDDRDERRRQRREQKHRRLSSSSYTEPSTSSAAAAAAGLMTSDAYDPLRYTPRHAASTVLHHHGDGPLSSAGGSSAAAARPKQLRWEDEVRAKRERQNAEIASRPAPGGEMKGILKHAAAGESKGKGKARDLEDIEELRRAVERMEIPRGRDREPRGKDEWDAAWGVYAEDSGRDRKKKSKVLGDDRYRY
ncbi:69d35c20-46e7-4f0b-b0d7-5d87ca657562 [Thermothielavioides terrestris]|jgi:hypothetical protein|uniref:Uncharacterized protein n=2 Tax=Thermothielavioides terrestris TaxID=2587410 RepID=G2RBA4_THETT|nr:uncharacterized protein THITE_2155587 [Thermothielavioides terrestris NRRL 8126]AEO69075.1 hypothetical protein THITE_2155587 [Thermothielavioides terrestris NRRL 8126]SPQ22641.1 69d35c20-46e7-4f0b-b0d7-5d87ca657562 [Thermothielavioides terrestris]